MFMLEENKPTPTVFERLWLELSQRLHLAMQHSFNQNITYEDVLNIMVQIELSHTDDIKAEELERIIIEQSKSEIESKEE